MAEVDSSYVVRPPPLTQSDAITSLLSLSFSSAGALPASSGAIPETSPSASMLSTSGPQTSALSASLGAAASSATSNGKHHRRLGSTGKTRRRLSDAREASARPLLAAGPTNASGGLSLTSLSLSTSPPSSHGHSHSVGSIPHVIGHGNSHSYTHGYSPLAPKPSPVAVAPGVPIAIVSGSTPKPISVSGFTIPGSVDSDLSSIKAGSSENGTNDQDDNGSSTTPIPITGGKAKKRGIDYKCESCSKIYRHPNCLNKHRWEHTKQWREASKFVLSKHQQVQLLEAAAILSYMGKSPSSLPEDRSEWPSFLSGGSLPKTEPVSGSANSSTITSAAGGANGSSAPPPGMPAYGSIGHAQPGYGGTRTYPLHPHPISVSVPTGTTATGSGPRMHDYTIPVGGGRAGSVVPQPAGVVTQVAPGLVGVPTVPTPSGGHTIIGGAVDRSGLSIGFGSGGWSLPSSSVRSGPASLSYSSTSRSRSGSGSRSRSGSGSSVDIDVVGMDEDEEDTGVASTTTMSPRAPINVVRPGQQQSHIMGMGMGYSPGYGYAGYSSGSFRRGGMMMKREEDEMSVGFSVKEEDEDAEEEEEEEEDLVHHNKKGMQDRWNGMEMDLDMDMD